MKNIVLKIVLMMLVVTVLFACSKKAAINETGVVETAIETNVVEKNVKETEVADNKTARKDMTEIIMEHFKKFTEIPRPSYHEEKISEYVYNWAKEKGFEATRDKENNVIVDVPATKGMENVPLTCLQGHIDMVFAKKEGLDLDPLTTKINLVVEGDKVTSGEITSIGADDGIGDAIAMCIAEGYMNHGPLRLIFTTAEEVGMEGAQALGPNVVKDCKYMINIDSEISDTITVSSAAGMDYDIKKNYNMGDPKYNKAYEIEINNCKGGHSGNDIKYGRANAIIELAKIIKDSKSSYEIVSFAGGSAKNAIPTKAKAVVIFKDDVERELNDKFNEVKEKYKENDKDISFSIKEVEKPSKAINETDSKSIINLISNFVDGVHTWSKDIENLPESSSNLGVANCDDGNLQIIIFARSSSNDKMREIDNLHKENAKNNGIDNISTKETAKAWEYNPNSKLLKIAKNAYDEVLRKEVNIEAVHAGLECGVFAEYNPNMEIIAIGPDIRSAHSIRETLTLSSIKIVWDSMEKILNNLEK